MCYCVCSPVASEQAEAEITPSLRGGSKLCELLLCLLSRAKSELASYLGTMRLASK